MSKAFDKAITSSITEATQSANSNATMLFINEVYPRLSDVIPLEAGASMAKGLEGEELDFVDRSIRKFMFGTDILKIKIFTTNGLTVYSSDPSQIGEDKSDNSAFLSAKQGIPGSQVTHRGEFSALDGEVFNRDLVSSYIPIRSASQKIIGVAELYTDRTPVIERSHKAVTKIQAILAVAMTITLAFIIGMFWAFWARLSSVVSKDDAV